MSDSQVANANGSVSTTPVAAESKQQPINNLDRIQKGKTEIKTYEVVIPVSALGTPEYKAMLAMLQPRGKSELIEVGKAGMTIGACPHAGTVDKLNRIRHNFAWAGEGLGWQFDVAIACPDCNSDILASIKPVTTSDEEFEAAVERICTKQITLDCDLYVTKEGTIVTGDEKLQIETVIGTLPRQCWSEDRYGNMIAFATPEIAARCPRAAEDGLSYYREHGLANYSKSDDKIIIMIDNVKVLLQSAYKA